MVSSSRPSLRSSTSRLSNSFTSTPAHDQRTLDSFFTKPLPYSDNAGQNATNLPPNAPVPPKPKITYSRPVASRTNTTTADQTHEDEPPTKKIALTNPNEDAVIPQLPTPVANGISDTKKKALRHVASPSPRSSRASTPRTLPHGTRTTAPGQGAKKSEDKRSLRSMDTGTRLKSDLATYFPNYEELMFGEPVEPDFLALDTPILIFNEELPPPVLQQTPPSVSSRRKLSLSPEAARQTNRSPSKLKPPPPPPLQRSNSSFNGFPVIDFSSVERNIPLSSFEADPLGESTYLKVHRRAERKEKQLRNIEKERSLFEKYQLEKLLDSLKGESWLRVMGIHAVTEAETKHWKEKRDYFIKEVAALLDKFKAWKEEETRLRLLKEEAAREKEEEEDEDGTEQSSIDSRQASMQPKTRKVHKDTTSTASQGNSQESQPSSRRRPRPPEPPKPPEPEKPFTSFYSKPYLRAAALGKHRHGRNVTAFGLPLPDMPEKEFELPDGFVTEEMLVANARRRRRLRREAKEKEREGGAAAGAGASAPSSQVSGK